MARALSQLQKVDVELAATSGHRSSTSARALSSHEVSVTEMKFCLEVRPNPMKSLIRNK